MRSLDQALQTCESYLPGLIDGLDALPFAERESRESKAIAIFRECKGPGLVIPEEYGGLGASPVDALRVLRAVGATSPSLAVASTMHHFSVATLFTLADSVQQSGLEWAVLEAITTNSLLVSSGFAEGRHGQSILEPIMTATETDDGFVVNGAKKPCSLSRSMDLLTASIGLPSEDGEHTDLAVMLIPSDIAGLSVHPFWASDVLAGAESDEVRLTDVLVEKELVVRTEPGDDSGLDELQTLGFMWFELLISASYLGVASALVARALSSGRGSLTDRAAMGVRLETAGLLLEGAARTIAEGRSSNDGLAEVMLARYGAQEAIADAARLAVTALGGMAFISDGAVGYLSAACLCLGFHPPSRTSVEGTLVDYLSGAGPLRLS